MFYNPPLRQRLSIEIKVSLRHHPHQRRRRHHQCSDALLGSRSAKDEKLRPIEQDYARKCQHGERVQRSVGYVVSSIDPDQTGVDVLESIEPRGQPVRRRAPRAAELCQGDARRVEIADGSMCESHGSELEGAANYSQYHPGGWGWPHGKNYVQV